MLDNKIRNHFTMYEEMSFGLFKDNVTNKLFAYNLYVYFLLRIRRR